MLPELSTTNRMFGCARRRQVVPDEKLRVIGKRGERPIGRPKLRTGREPTDACLSIGVIVDIP